MTIYYKELRIVMAKQVDKAWKTACASSMVEKAFTVVGPSINIPGSQDHRMKFQLQEAWKHAEIIIQNQFHAPSK